jgi:hypothetical protein
MKPTAQFTTTAILVAGFLTATSLVAQRGPGAGRNYDPKTVETVQGKVVSVENIAPPHHGYGPGMGSIGMGIHLNLQTEKETIAVHLGPDWFMKKQTPQIETGDSITMTGSRVTFDGKPAIIAAEIRKGDKVLKLRDENGVPLWAGRGRPGQ